MPRFLYMFGYEGPEEAEVNAATGSDYEVCRAVFIQAEDAAAAVAWGQQVSQRYVSWLFEREGRPRYEWIEANFANWLEREGTNSWDVFKDAPRIDVGEYPAFDHLEGHDSEAT